VSPDYLDEAVDRAVRELMDVEPADDLGGRILRRVSAPRSSMPFRTLTLVAAACLLLLGVVAPRALREWRSGSVPNTAPARLQTAESPERAPATPPIEDARTQSSPAAAAAAAADVATEPTVASARRRPGPSPRSRRDARAQSPQAVAQASPESAAALPSWPAEVVVIEQLAPISAIAVAPLSHLPLRIEEITIDPLEIEPLHVDPLSSSTQQ
jgi:hypothetical protein